MSEHNGVLNIPYAWLSEIEVSASRDVWSRIGEIRETIRHYFSEQRKTDIRTSLQQGYLDMASINLRIASESFAAEHDAGGTVERLVSGV